MVALDLECSNGVTVPDPGINTTARSNLIFSTTPPTPAGNGMALASSYSTDVLASFEAGDDAGSYARLSVVSCSGSNIFLGAKVERWTPGESGTLGNTYAGFMK